jgi:PhnB protein
MPIRPYLDFDGHAEEAIAFYERALGAKLQFLMRLGESPEPPPPGMVPPGKERKVMHADLKIGDAHLMVSDGRCGGTPAFTGVMLNLPLPDAAAAQRAFDGLADGGQVTMPIGATFFSPCFGMVTDRFGVHWMVMVDRPMPT